MLNYVEDDFGNSLEYLMHEECQDVQHEEGFGKMLLCVTEVVLQVIAFILDLPPGASPAHQFLYVLLSDLDVADP